MTERQSIFKVRQRAALMGRRESPEIEPTHREYAAPVGLWPTDAEHRTHTSVMVFGPDQGVSLAAHTIEGR